MKASYVSHMGDDNSVVDAARVSFSKKALNYSKEKNDKLIVYLATHGHWSPFGHTAITVHVKAPLFVARQLGKHQVGFVWNEVSRRYVTEEPEFYTPEFWRKAAENVKQGSSDEPVDLNETIQKIWTMTCENYKKAYKEMVSHKMCPEHVRIMMPQAQYTEWYWTGNLYGFAQMYNKRTKPDTQRETQEIARQIGDIIQPLYPVSWSALTGETT